MNDEPRLEALLDQLPRVKASPSLRRRIFEIPAREPRAALPAWLSWFVGRRAAALALALVLVGLGTLGGMATSESEPTAEAEAESEQWRELSELALATELVEDF